MKTRISKAHPRNGLSLLEVMLAIGILGGSLAIIGTLVDLGYQHALNTRLRSDANVICDTTMAEVAAGVLPLESAAQQTVPTASDWVYTISVDDSDQPGLLVVSVVVQQQQQTTRRPLIVMATRFMADPDYEPEEEEDE